MPQSISRLVLISVGCLVILVAYLTRPESLDLERPPPPKGPVMETRTAQEVPIEDMRTANGGFRVISESEVDALLVTKSHPARNDGSTMDVARCAALHNYIVQHGWLASGRSLDDLPRQSYFEQHSGAIAEAVFGNQVDPYLLSFFKSVITNRLDVSFHYWVGGLYDPGLLFESAGSFPENMEDEEGRVVTLYAVGQPISHGAGLMYDQKLHRAYFSMTIWEHDHASPIEEHDDLWYPLETVLSNFIELIRIGKITATQEESANEKVDVWTWHPYGAAQVDSAVAAFEHLVEVIEERIPPSALLPTRDGEQLLADADLDAASVPAECFARSFLTRIRTPRFRSIAPGLLVPRDPAAFASCQRFTTVPVPPDAEWDDPPSVIIPPVLIFPAAGGRTANLDSAETSKYDKPDCFVTLNPFCRPYSAAVPRGDHATPAGLYSESVDRGERDNAEEGFRLILPSGLRPFGEGGDESGMGKLGGKKGARLSDGSLVREGYPTQLFQHGVHPFGGDAGGRAQRLERLFEKWTENVENGVWTVGRDGVEGGIDMFKDADGLGWKNYWIPPSW